MSDDLIWRHVAIDEIKEIYEWHDNVTEARIIEHFKRMPSAQPESYEEKLKEIADALSEKFAYMNTCLNERDIILGYLGVKRPSIIHCNTDCTNIKCESHRCYKKLPSEQIKIVRCKDCKWFAEFCDEYKQESRKDGMCEHPKFGRYTLNTTFDYYCADGEKG